MRKPDEGRPFNFVHNIYIMYHKFHNSDWFYPATGYSEEFQKRVCWKFDGQFFYKEKK